MADRKITDMSALAAGSQATGDLIAVVDVSEAAAADKNKKMTMENLFKGIPGNVGINNTDPLAQLHILNTSGTTGLYVSRASGTVIGDQISIHLSTDSAKPKITGYGDGLTFFTAAKSGTASERMRINSSGRVGIGTTAPTAELHVVKSSGESSLFLDRTSGALLYMQGTASAAVIGTGTDHPIYIRQNSGDAITIDTSKRVGIGTTTPGSFFANADNLVVGTGSANNGITIYSGTTSEAALCFADGTASNAPYIGRILYNHNTDSLQFDTSALPRMTIDSSGNIFAGRTSLGTPGGITPRLQVHGTDNSAFFAITRASDNNEPPYLGFAKTRGGDNTAVASGDSLGAIFFAGGDGTDNHTAAAQIEAEADATPASNDVRGRIVFKTRNSTSPPVERMRITSDGNIQLPANATATGNRLQLGASQQLEILQDSANAYIANDDLIISNGAISQTQARFTAGAAVELYYANGKKLETLSNGVHIDGRLGIGVTAPTTPLHVNQGATATADVARFSQDSDSGLQQKITIGFTKDKSDTHPAVRLGALEFDTGDRRASFFVATRGSNDDTAPTERMRITDAGQHFAISSDNTLTSSTTQAAGTTYLTFRGRHSASSILGGTESFKVFSNGDVQNTNDSYGAISDVKLKENIVDAGSQWDDFKAVRFRKFNFKESTGHETFTQLGVIAQELELVSPGLISESPDLDDEGNNLGTVTKSVKYSVLTKKALVALQEAMTRIETLEAKVAALEAG